MARSGHRIAIPLAGLVALALSGCATGSPGVAEVSSLGFLGAEAVEGSPAEAYVRIARGAKSCWFGASGPLRGTHLFVGEVRPQSKGGDASIILYEAAGEGQRGLKAFSISMKQSGEKTAVARENARMPEALGGQMLADVDRWAEGQTGCAGEAADWEPAAPDAAPSAAPAAKTKARKKATAT